ncbi:hypothetical protein RYX36_035482 [Vicia faba]
MVENLQFAHQELSVIIDIINTVEANDAVAVASMNRPKSLPNETLSDLAVSEATKLQCYRQVGKYFRQSAKAFEQQVAREARFYGALIRLQQNWKVKRRRQTSLVPGNEGSTFDLFDNSYDQEAIFRSPHMSTVRVNDGAAGMLAINVSPELCHSLQFGFVGAQPDDVQKKSHQQIPLLLHYAAHLSFQNHSLLLTLLLLLLTRTFQPIILAFMPPMISSHNITTFTKLEIKARDRS